MRAILRLLLLALTVALVMPSSGVTVTNCLRLVTYSGNWHLEGTLQKFTGLDLAVDKMGDGWSVVSHHTRGWGYVSKRTSMPAVSYLDFSEHLYSVDIVGTNDFYAVFNWHEGGPRDDLAAYNGWVHLRYEGGTLAIVGSAIGTERGERVLYVEDEDNPWQDAGTLVLFNYQVTGESVRLVRPCVPSETEGRIVIPDKIEGLPVVEIDGFAFSGCSGITEVVIPETVQIIYREAFLGCSALTNVVFPRSLEKIGDEAFIGCASLASVCLPESVSLADQVFPETCRVRCRYRWDVGDVDVSPEGEFLLIKETEWRINRFADHAELAGDCLPKREAGVVSIPDEIDGLPVTSIGQDAFYGNMWMTGLVIPNSVSNLGYKSIAAAEALRNLVIPDSVTNIDFAAVSECRDLRELVVGGVVATMGEYAFSNAEALTNVVIRNGLREIPRWAFAGCRSLKTLALPPSVRVIAAGAFSGCSSLESVSLFTGTQVESGAFPSACRITYSGPRVALLDDGAYERDDLYRSALAVADLEQWRTALQVTAKFEDADTGTASARWSDLAALLSMGISPSRYEMRNNGTLDAFFARPQVQVVGLSVDLSQLVVRVNPAEGSKIVHSDDVADCVNVQIAESLDELNMGWGLNLSMQEGFSVDSSDYVENGEIRVSLEGLLKKDASQFFRLGFRY